MSTLTNKEIAVIVDEMAELERQLTPLSKRFDALKKQLSEYANSQEDEDCIFLASDNNYITYTKPTYSLVCKDVQTFLKETKCFDAVTVSVSKAKDKCTPDVVAELFEYKKGSRKMLSIIPIAS